MHNQSATVDAFAEIVQRHDRPLHAFLWNQGCNRSDIEDIAQSCWLRLWSNQSVEVNEVEQPRPITLSRLIWIARSEMSHRWDADRRERQRLEAYGQLAPLSWSDPDSFVGIDLEAYEISPLDARILHLTYVEGRRSTEVGELTGLSASSVRKHLERARRSLAQIIQQHQQQDDDQ